MMRSLFSGVSGLKVHQTRMDVIGNNIANINTIGFKSSRTTFSDMLSQIQSSAAAPTDGLGGINAKQIGLGVNVESIDIIFTDSSPQQTGKNTDLALSGNGLFVLRNGDQSFYTRNGAFAFDEAGYYVLPGSGLRVQGWNAGDDGAINTNGTATDIIVPVGKTMEATATTAIDYSGNLNKEELAIEKISYVTANGGDNSLVITNETEYTTNITAPADTGTITYNLTTTSMSTTQSYASGDTIKLTYRNAGGTAGDYTADLYDPSGNKVGTATSTSTEDTNPFINGATVDATAAADSTESGTATTSVNIDGTNVIAATLTLKDGTTRHVTSGYYEVGKSIPITTLATVYDSLGGRHEVTVLIDKDSSTADTTANADAIETGKICAADGSPVDGAVFVSIDDDGNVTYTIGTGTTEYTGGKMVYDNRWRAYLAPGVGVPGPASTDFSNVISSTESDGSTMVAKMNGGDEFSYLYFDSNGQFVTNGSSQDAEITFTYGDGNGAGDNTGIISFTGLTQYANSTTSFPITNGNTAGILQSLAIDGNGIISGTYTNGLVRAEAQIAVAQFNNSSGLTKVGTTIYTESNNSGAANIKTIADFGLNVVSSALEMSNVDLATEFSDMIITQRGFQANSKMTTVSDEMLETLVNMKR